MSDLRRDFEGSGKDWSRPIICMEGVPVMQPTYNPQPDHMVYMPDPQQQPLRILYQNWRGEVAWRNIIPSRTWWGATSFHPEPQWLMDALDVDKQCVRTFSMKGIIRVEEGVPPTIAPAS